MHVGIDRRKDCDNSANLFLDPVDTMSVEFENGTKVLSLVVAFIHDTDMKNLM